MVSYGHELETNWEPKKQLKKRQAEAMSEWQDMQKKPIIDFHKFLQERFDKTSPRHQLAKDETTKLAKLEGIAQIASADTYSWPLKAISMFEHTFSRKLIINRLYFEGSQAKRPLKRVKRV